MFNVSLFPLFQHHCFMKYWTWKRKCTLNSKWYVFLSPHSSVKLDSRSIVFFRAILKLVLNDNKGIRWTVKPFVYVVVYESREFAQSRTEKNADCRKRRNWFFATYIHMWNSECSALWRLRTLKSTLLRHITSLASSQLVAVGLIFLALSLALSVVTVVGRFKLHLQLTFCAIKQWTKSID